MINDNSPSDGHQIDQSLSNTLDGQISENAPDAYRDPFDMDFNDIMECNRRTHPSGLWYHYTDMSALSAILNGAQFRLSRWDVMGVSDEGRQIYVIARKTLQELKEEGIIDDKDLDWFLSQLPSGDGLTVQRFLTDTNAGSSGKYCECVPYVICFTRLRMNEGSLEIQNKITGKPLRLEFTSQELEAYKDESFKAIDFVLMDYGHDCLHKALKQRIGFRMTRYKNDVSKEETLEWIIREIDDLRFSKFDHGHADEKEARLVFYVPRDTEAHPRIKALIGKHRIRDEEGNPIPANDDTDSYIFLNFPDTMSTLHVGINPQPYISTEKYKSMVAKAGYNPIVGVVLPENEYRLRIQIRTELMLSGPSGPVNCL